MSNCFVSFIILCKTPPEIDKFKKCLSSIKQQTDNSFEWMVIGDLTNKVPECRCHVCSDLSMVNGEYLIFLHADNLIESEDFVSELKNVVNMHPDKLEWITWESKTWETSFCINKDLFSTCTKNCKKDGNCKLVEYLTNNKVSTLHLQDSPVL